MKNVYFVMIGVASYFAICSGCLAAFRPDIAYNCHGSENRQVALIFLSNHVYFERWTPTARQGATVLTGHWNLQKQGSTRFKAGPEGMDGEILEFSDVMVYQPRSHDFASTSRPTAFPKTMSDKRVTDFLVRVETDVPQTIKYAIAFRCAEEPTATEAASSSALEADKDATAQRRSVSAKDRELNAMKASCDVPMDDFHILVFNRNLNDALEKETAAAVAKRYSNCSALAGSYQADGRFHDAAPNARNAQCKVLMVLMYNLRRACAGE